MATIEEIRNLAEPLKGYQFRVTISNAPGTGASIELLQFRCTSAAIPGKDIDEVLVELGSYVTRHAGKTRFPGAWTVTFIEGTDVQIIERMRSWQEVCHNSASGVQADADGYKRNIVIELLDNADQVAQSHRIVGAWPQSVPDVVMDSSSSEAVRYDVTFAYDYHEVV